MKKVYDTQLLFRISDKLGEFQFISPQVSVPNPCYTSAQNRDQSRKTIRRERGLSVIPFQIRNKDNSFKATSAFELHCAQFAEDEK